MERRRDATRVSFERSEYKAVESEAVAVAAPCPPTIIIPGRVYARLYTDGASIHGRGRTTGLAGALLCHSTKAFVPIICIRCRGAGTAFQPSPLSLSPLPVFLASRHFAVIPRTGYIRDTLYTHTNRALKAGNSLA